MKCKTSLLAQNSGATVDQGWVCPCVCLCVEVGGWARIFKKSLFIPFLIFGIKNEIIKAKLTEEYDLCRQK